MVMVIISHGYGWNVLSLDEGTYLSIGMLMSRGWVVYRDVFESKPPVFHFLNYFIYLLTGNRLHAARLFSIAAGALTAYDLPDLIGCIAPRKVLLHELKDQMGNTAPGELIEKELEFPRSVYSSKYAAENLRVLGPDSYYDFKSILDWWID